MNNKNFLSNIRSPFLDSPSSDVGHRRRVVADLLPSFCRVNHVLTLLVVMLFTIGSGNVWATYKLTEVTSVSAGNKYVFVEDGYALRGAISSSAVQTTNSYNSTGLAGNETYVWELSTSTHGYYIANCSIPTNKYLKNGSSTSCSLVASSNTPSEWTFSWSAGKANLINYSNANRYLGETSDNSHAFKAYSESGHAKNFTVYLLEEESSCTSSITITKGSNPANGTFTITTSGSVCIDKGNASTTVNATPNSHYHLATVTSTGGGSVGVISNNTCTVSNISANTTINVTFAADPTYTVTWVAGSNPSFSTQTNYAGTALTDPGTPSSALYCPGGKEFVGWTATPIAGEGSEPADLFTSVSGKSIPVDGITYYAVFATRGGSGSVTKSDELTYTSFFAACSSSGSNTSGSYTDFSNKSGSESDAVYAGNLFKHGNGPSNCKDYIQMRTSSNCGFFTTTSGGKAKKVTIEWNAATTTTRTVDIYGKNTAYSAIGDLFDNAKQGTLLGSITWASPTPGTELTITGDYEYIGLRSNNGALYLSSITIDWQASGGYTYSDYATTCCTPLASINGSFSFTSVGTTGATANWGWTGATTGISKNILKVYKESDNSLVTTIDNISASATSQAITGLDPCTEYYVKLSTVSSGGGYCDGVADQTGASHVTFTTSSYTVTKTGVTNVTAASLSAIPATTCASGFGPITIEAASGYVLPTTVTVTGAIGSWTQATGSLTISNVTGNVSITITPTAASCASFSFHTGTGDDAIVKTTNTTTCFSQVNSSTTWKIDNYVIPADTKFFVGDRGFFYDDNLGSNNSRSAVKTWSQEMFFEYTKAYGDGYRPTVGQATGAIGTLYIWSDNNWNNLHVGFSPQGYVFKLGSTNLSMSGSTTLDADRYWETSVITLTSTDISGNYQTNLYTGSAGGVASNNTQSTAVNTMGVKTNAGDNWRGTAINDGTDANTRGFFRIDIGDGGTKNWHAHWVPTHRVVFHPNYPGGGGEDQYSVDVSVEETNSSIALASAPSNPTGYTFAGWYDAADGGNHITTARTISAGASANVELWAHWTANTIALTLDKNNNDASGSTSGSASVKYDNTALESGTTHATREHYTLEGYYAEAGCTHKVLTAAGALVNYTGYVESGKWVRNTTPTTLYANWTPANYTVSWQVNGEAWTSGVTSANNNADYNTTVSAPTAPADDAVSCANKFMGWTATPLGSATGQSAPGDLFTTTSPAITANTTFYAVFATGSSGGAVTYTKVTSISAGTYLMATETADNFLTQTTLAYTGDNGTGNYGGVVSVSISTNVISTKPASAKEITVTLGTGDDDGYFAMYDGSKYITQTVKNKFTFSDDISYEWNLNANGQIHQKETYDSSDDVRIYMDNGNTGTQTEIFKPLKAKTEGYNSGTYYYHAYLFKKEGGTTYSDYVTSCCSLKSVTSLAVSSSTANSVTLSWTAPSPTTGIDHLELRNASTDAKIGSNMSVGTTSASVSGLTECNNYSYKVVSVGATCETSSDVIEVQPYSGAKTVNFNYNGGTGSLASFTTSCSGNTVALPTPDTRAGYTFLGWWSAQNGGTKKGDAGDTYTVTGNTTIWAHWSETNHTVTMAQSPAAGATLTGGTTTAHYGNTINISTDVPSGYRFTGWTSSPSVTFADASATSTSFTMPDGNVTVTANFTQTHAVSFSVPTGGGTVVSPPSTVDHGGTLTFPNVTDVDCGTFLGWTTAANSSYSSTSGPPTPLYAAAATTTINDAATFYAVYSKLGDNPVAATLYAHSEGTTVDNTGYTNVTITTNSLGVYSNGVANDGNYKVKFDAAGDYIIFELDGTPTSFNANFRNAGAGTAGNTGFTLYQSSSTSGPWAAIGDEVGSDAKDATYSLNITNAALFSQRVLKLAKTSHSLNTGMSTITINGLRAPITYSTNPDCIDWRLQSIAVTTAPTKTTYDECEEFDPAGMVVTATMYDNDNPETTTTKAVAGYTWTPEQFLTPGNAVAVAISYTEKGVTRTTTLTVRVNDLTNYTVTFHDGNRTPVDWTQSNHCEPVDLDDYTGALECGDYTFVGWSTSSTTYNDQAATITTWVSGEYLPTANIDLYAVYRKGAAAPDFTANCDGGTYYIYEANGNTHMAGRVNATPRAYTSEYWNNDGGTGCVACLDDGPDLTPFTFTKIAENTYKIQNSAGEYLRKYYSGNHPYFESTWYDEDNFKWVISAGTNGTWRFVCKAADTYALVKSGSYFDFQLASNVTALSSYYDLELEPAASTVYQSNPNCASTYTITFNTYGGTFDGSSPYEYGAATTVSDIASGTHVHLPSASYPGGWTFVGWKESKQDESIDDNPEGSTAGQPVGIITAGTDVTITSDKVYHAVYHFFDDDWTFDAEEGGTYHMYVERSGTKHYVSSTPTNSWAALATSTDCDDAKDITITPGTGVNAGKYSIAVDGYTIIPENGATNFKRGTFWWTITDNGDGTYAINGMNDDRNIVSNSSGSHFQHVAYNGGLGLYSGWYYPSFGRCRQHHWTSEPTPMPTITLGSTGPLNITSTNGKTTWATSQLTVRATHYEGTTKLYLSSNVAGVGFLSSSGSALSSDAHGTYIQTDANGDLATTNIVVTYSPSVSTDGIENATITVQDNSSPSILATATRTLKLRHLPTKFIIAEKVGDDWYALPNNMSNSQTNPAKVKISSVNEATGVATIYSDVTDHLAWAMGMTTQASKKYTMEFYSDLVNDAKYLKTHTSNANTIGQYAKQTGSSQNYTEFKPATSDLVDYTLYNEQWSYYLGISGDVWGVYSSSATVRFFTIDQQPAPTITWQNDMLGSQHAQNTAENGVVTLPTGADPVSCNTTLYPTFCGWKDGQIATYVTVEPTYVQAGDVVTTDKTYYAVFKDATRNRWYTSCPTYYTLTFQAGTGTGDNYLAYTENTTYVMPDAATTGQSKEGYTLSGWTTTVNVTVGGNTITAGDVIGVGSTISGISGDMTFTAVWTGNISITATNGIWLTSYNGVTVYATSTTSNLITVSSADATGATRFRIIYLDGNGDVVAKGSSLFRLCNNGSVNYNMVDASSDYVSVSSGSYSQTYSISYTPNAHNTINTGTLKLQLMHNSTVLSEATLVLHGRALPQEFVVASKFNGEWYALPNTLEATEAAARAVAGIRITVDNTTTPTKATYAPSSTIYQGEGRYAANSNRYGIRLTDGTNHLQVSTTNNVNKMWLSSTGSANCQDWWLSSTNFGAYSVTIPSNTGNESKKIGMDGGNIGYYASPTSPSEQIYFLPITNKLVDNPAIVTEWGRKSVILDVDAQTASSAQARLGAGEPEAAASFGQTRTSVKGSATKYNYTLSFSTLDFSAHKGELLYIDWLDGEDNVLSTSALTIPWIIATNSVMGSIDNVQAHWKDWEVHVLPGVTLEADGSSFASSTAKVRSLEIYPGAIVKVTSGTLDVAMDLVLRYGWTRASEKSYNVAQLQIKRGEGGANVTTNHVYADWYIDYDQYYPISVPWNVTVANITYKNSNSAASAGMKLRYYDGESRAANGQTGVDAGSNWKEYSPLPATLEPSKGYALTAKRPSGKAFSILRMPLTIPSASWTALGEQGEVSSVHKNQVSVTGYGMGSSEWYAMGWNFIGNPYMSTFNGDDEGISGKLELQNGGSIRYATIPDLEFRNYYQVNIAEANLKPASGFFVQANNADAQTITFAAGNMIAPSAPARHAENSETIIPEQEAYIRLSNGGDKDQMGLIIGDNYTAEYEPNADLAKVLGEGNFVKTYMRYINMDMAYVAINATLAKEWIPITVKIPADGEYTYSLTNSSIVDKLEGVYLIDYANGDKITNLIEENYTFEAQAGTISNRFAINAIVGKRDTPTGVDAVDWKTDTSQPIKFIYHDNVYILYRDVIFDATGKKVREINK